DGDATITEPAVPFLDNDPRLAIFLVTPSVVIGTGSVLTTTEATPRAYRLADIKPVLLDPNTSASGTPLQVRVVVLDFATGAVTTELVQEKGVLEKATQKKNSSNQPLWFAKDGGETTDSAETGIPVLIFASGGQVYLGSAFNKVLTNTGHLSYTTDFVNGSNLYIDSGGFRTTTVVSGRPSLIEINTTTLAAFQRVLDTVQTAPSAGVVLKTVNTGDTSDVTGSLDQIHVSLAHLAADA